MEIENHNLHGQVQQLQEQVSSVVFHHTCAVCGVCRCLLLCPHNHSWVVRREVAEELGEGGWGVVNMAKFQGLRVAPSVSIK